MWLSGEDIIKITQYEKAPIIDYWHLLNRKYNAAEKAQAELDKIRNRTKRFSK